MFVSGFYEIVSNILCWNKQFISNISLSYDFLGMENFLEN